MRTLGQTLIRYDQWTSKERKCGHSFRGRTLGRLREKAVTYKPWRKASEESNSVQTWIADTQLLELKENKFLLLKLKTQVVIFFIVPPSSSTAHHQSPLVNFLLLFIQIPALVILYPSWPHFSNPMNHPVMLNFHFSCSIISIFYLHCLHRI